MSDKWLDPDNERLGRTLLAAGAEERPNEATMRRALAAVTATAATLTVASEVSAALTGTAGASLGAAGSSSSAAATGKAALMTQAAGSAAGGGLGASLTAGAAAKSALGTTFVKWLAGSLVVGATTVSVVEMSDDAPHVTPQSLLPSKGDVPESKAMAGGDRQHRAEALAPSDSAAANEAADEAATAVERETAQPEPGVPTLSSKATQLEPRAARRVKAESGAAEPVGGASSAVRAPFAEATTADRSADDELAPAGTTSPSELEAQLALIDAARALVGAGRGAEALVKLDQYRERFGSGRLGPEALFLRMQAYQRSGQVAAAERTAEAILERYPRGPHAGKARELLRR